MVTITLNDGETINAYGLVNHPDIRSFFDDVNAEDNDVFNARAKIIAKNYGDTLFYITFNKEDEMEIVCLNVDTDNNADLLAVVTYVVAKMEAK